MAEQVARSSTSLYPIWNLPVFKITKSLTKYAWESDDMFSVQKSMVILLLLV